jgi:hypothetical protein
MILSENNIAFHNYLDVSLQYSPDRTIGFFRKLKHLTEVVQRCVRRVQVKSQKDCSETGGMLSKPYTPGMNFATVNSLFHSAQKCQHRTAHARRQTHQQELQGGVTLIIAKWRSIYALTIFQIKKQPRQWDCFLPFRIKSAGGMKYNPLEFKGYTKVKIRDPNSQFTKCCKGIGEIISCSNKPGICNPA